MDLCTVLSACLYILSRTFYTKRSRRNEIVNKQYFLRSFPRNYYYTILPNDFLVPLITDFVVVVVTIFPAHNFFATLSMYLHLFPIFSSSSLYSYAEACFCSRYKYICVKTKYKNVWYYNTAISQLCGS